MGRILPNALAKGDAKYPTVAAALAAHGLNISFTKRPLFARIPHADDRAHGIMKRADGLYAIVRDDNNRTVGAVKAKYTVVNPEPAFGLLDVLARDGQVCISHASSIDGGAKMFVQANTGTVKIAGEPVQQYVLAKASFDGTGSISYLSGANRFFCTNQLQGIMRDAYFRELIRHTLSAHVRIEDARKTLAAIYTEQRKFVVTAEALLAQTFSRAEMEALAIALIPRPDEADPTTTRREVSGWETRFERLMREAYGAPDLNDIRFTAWGALNAVADYEQHLVPVKGDAETRESTLIRRAYEGGSLLARAAELVAAR